jgi:hypothetical protein
MPSVCLALIILEMDSSKLFARAGLEPQSSWSQTSKELGCKSEPPAPSKDGFFFFVQYWGLNLAFTLGASTSTFFFVLGVFKIESLELFVQAGFEPQSSWLLPLE